MAARQHKTGSSREYIWVIGGGQFGRRAGELLLNTASANKIIVVDHLPIEDLPGDIQFVCADGVEWLVEQFTPDAVVSKIVPALPVHLAAEWLKQKLLDEQLIVRGVEIPELVFNRFPHPIRLAPDQAVASHADFLCPPNCSEPDELCTFTQEPRPQSMYRLLERMDCGTYVPIIVRSRQFAPGVGGFFPDDLWNLLERARALPEIPLLIGTACKCHGIINTLCHTIA